MAETELIPVIGSRSPADFDDLFDELVAARGTQASVNARLAADESAIEDKQAALTEQQLAAVNSGATAENIAAIAANTTAIASVETATAEVSRTALDAANGETKNRLKLIKDDTFGYGIHVSFLDDGTIMVDGFKAGKAATGAFNLDIALVSDLGLKDGEKYILSDGLGTGSSNTFGLRAVDASGYVKKLWDSYTNPEITFNSSDADIAKIRLFVKSGTVMDHVHIKPMICTKNNYTESSKFVPYETAESDVPDYFELPKVLGKVQDNIKTAGKDGKTFIFATDMHWSTNNTKFSRSAPKLIKWLNDNDARIDTCVLGGDYIDGGDHDTILRLMEECAKKFAANDCKTFALFGNHDSNTIYTSAVTPFTNAEFYGAVQAFNSDDAHYEAYRYFYADDEKSKTRMIFLDSGVDGDTLSAAQSDWLDATLASTPNGWHIIAFWHLVYDIQSGTTWNDNPLSLEITAFSTAVCAKLDAHNAGSAGSTVEAIIGGHIHCDKNFATTGGIPIVLTTTAGLGLLTEGATGTKGTKTETAFDVITIDYEAKSVKCARVGRGNDRTISYS